jgi:hypothetical protein
MDKFVAITDDEFNNRMGKSLQHIRDYDPLDKIIVYDEFEFEKLVEYYRSVARVGLGEISSTE